MVVYISWLHSCVCGCDGDIICVGHDLNRALGGGKSEVYM